MSDVALKTERLEARVPSPLKELLQKAAALTGQTLTDFVISSSTASARQVIRENELLELSQADQVAFAQSLITPPKANKKLRKAAAKFAGETAK